MRIMVDWHIGKCMRGYERTTRLNMLGERKPEAKKDPWRFPDMGIIQRQQEATLYHGNIIRQWKVCGWASATTKGATPQPRFFAKTAKGFYNENQSIHYMFYVHSVVLLYSIGLHHIA